MWQFGEFSQIQSHIKTKSVSKTLCYNNNLLVLIVPRCIQLVLKSSVKQLNAEIIPQTALHYTLGYWL